MTDAVQTVGGEKINTGGWAPPLGPAVSPLLMWPPRPLALFKWVFGFPGYLLPWNLFYAATAALSWIYLYPPFDEMKTFAFGWVAQILAINLVWVGAFASIWHFRLYIRRTQGIEFKFNTRWPRENSTFLFRNQHIDNVIWTLCSGVPVMTGFMVVTLWGMANGWLPCVSWADHPVYLALVMFGTNLFRNVHFYLIHRLIHWPPLYRFHALHHKNTNPGPWSGLSMHPVEHLLYFTCVLIHWVVPSHPILILHNLFGASFGAVWGHTGFAKLVIDGKRRIDASSYMHYLHHRYFEVNYGDGALPVDKFLGTWHDGTREAHAAMQRRLQKANIRIPDSV